MVTQRLINRKYRMETGKEVADVPLKSSVYVVNSNFLGCFDRKPKGNGQIYPNWREF